VAAPEERTMTHRGEVVSIHLQPQKGQPPRPVAEALALIGYGLKGDYHGKQRSGSSRQVLLVDRRTLDALGFAHGALREQLTVDLPGLDSLATGVRLTIGEAVLELTGPCEPCEVIGRINGVDDPYALRDALQGRRGLLARVVEVRGNGRIGLGDAITITMPATGGRE
jgi:MOSC domain-containing protein YiiM